MDSTNYQSCYDRWLSKNLGGTYPEFLKARKDYIEKRPLVPTPKLARIPDGTFVPKKGITPAEAGTITAEYVKNSAGSQ